jgi:hypothetical protein
VKTAPALASITDLMTVGVGDASQPYRLVFAKRTTPSIPTQISHTPFPVPIRRIAEQHRKVRLGTNRERLRIIRRVCNLAAVKRRRLGPVQHRLAVSAKLKKPLVSGANCLEKRIWQAGSGHFTIRAMLCCLQKPLSLSLSQGINSQRCVGHLVSLNYPQRIVADANCLKRGCSRP